MKKDFDRVILTCGASHPRDIKAPGREASGIYFAVDYLKRVTKHLRNTSFTDYIDAKGKNVTIKIHDFYKGLVIGKGGENIKRIAKAINAKRINVI